MGKRTAATGAMVLLAIACTFAQAASLLAGTVRDAAGLPMPGILVEISSADLAQPVRPVATDSRGRYRFDRLPPGTYAMTFTLIGFWSERRELQLPSGYRLPFNVRLYGRGESEPLPDSSAGATLHGTVVDQMQGVMPGVTLTLNGPIARTTKSDAPGGQFSFTGLPTGDYELRAALEGFATTVRKAALASGTKLTMRVEMSAVGTRSTTAATTR
jgi:hypothetical protein